MLAFLFYRPVRIYAIITAMAEQPPSVPRYGARVFPLAGNKALVKQTVKSGTAQNADYVIDEHRERHVDLGDDAQVAQAIRDALAGALPA